MLPQAPAVTGRTGIPERACTARDKVMLRLVAQGVWPEQVAGGAHRAGAGLRSLHADRCAAAVARLAADNQAGPWVHTTIDGDLLALAGGRVASYIRRFPEVAALLTVDNRTMAVRAYVGSAGMAQFAPPRLPRHGAGDPLPGSTLKPFIYGLAMDEGLVHSASCSPMRQGWALDYRPANFSGAFQGPVTLAQALQQSLNVPAVQVLEALGAGQTGQPSRQRRGEAGALRQTQSGHCAGGGGHSARAAGGPLQRADPAGAGGDAGLAGRAAGGVAPLLSPGRPGSSGRY